MLLEQGKQFLGQRKNVHGNTLKFSHKYSRIHQIL